MKIFKILQNPYIVLGKLIKGRLKFIDDKTYLKIVYRASFNQKLDFNNVITYNQKLQYLKIYNHNNLYKKLVDKYEVRQYVKTLIGEEYLIPCYGVWETFEDIDFSILPNEFVIKCTHDSGSVIVCTDKKDFDFCDARRKINAWLKKDYFWTSREWPYKDLKRKIIIEKLLVNKFNEPINDYKFFCFDGIPRLLYISSDRNLGNKKTKFDFFDLDFNRLELAQPHHPNSLYNFIEPKCFNKMKIIASKLSANLIHSRIDLYEVDGKIFFGEYTFFHAGGFVQFIPNEYDYILGNYINLNNLD